jgi:protein phosphatase
MTDDIICHFCSTTNKPDVKFCVECGSILGNNQPATIRLTSRENENVAPQTKNPNPGEVEKAAPDTKPSRSNTRPLERSSVFDPRPSGAIFLDRFLMDQLIYTDASSHQYLIHQLAKGIERYRLCPNPACRAIHPPGVENIYYCTDCGSQLGEDIPSLVLVETQESLNHNAGEIAEMALSHGSVRAPLAAFKEKLGSEIRHCIVQPFIEELPESIEAWQVLDWGPQLAYGLHYLHANGIYFDGEINAACFSSDEGRAVWSNFSDCRIASALEQKSYRADIRSLSALLFYWLTGNNKYKRDTRFTNDLNSVFERGLSPETYSTAAEFGATLALAVDDMLAPHIVDYVSGHRTDVGQLRSLNEDSLFVMESNRLVQSTSHPIGLFVVADGMGGHTAGEVASTAIVNSIAQKASMELFGTESDTNDDYDTRLWLQDAVQSANAAVFEIRKSTGTDLGSTLVAALLKANEANIAHVGDSRVYIIREGEIQQITKDHSLVERLVATGQISPEEARYHPQRNVIYRTIGDKPQVEVEMSSLQLSIGDRLLLCSDGLNGMLTDGEILRIVEGSQSPQAACNSLVEAANNTGGEDNITVILVEIISS